METGALTQFRTSTAFSDAEVVATPKQCRRCGYDLRGLTYGNPCPECGEIFAKIERVAEGMLGQAPGNYLNRLRLAAYLMALGGIGGSVVGVVMLLIMDASDAVTAGIALAARLTWIAGVVIIALPRPQLPGTTIGGPKEWRILRFTAAGSQFALLGVDTFVLIAEQTGTMAFYIPAIGLGAVASVGLVPVALLLAEYAHWASDDPLARRLEGVAWVLGVTFAAVLLQAVLTLLNVGISILFNAFILFVILVWGVAQVDLYIQCARVGNMITWAKRNAQNAAERERRRLERDRRAAQTAAIDAANVRPPIDVDEQLYEEVIRASEKDAADPQAPRPGDRSQPIIKRTDADPYDLED